METLQVTQKSTHAIFFEIIDSFYPVSDKLKEALLDSTYEVKHPKGKILFGLDEVVSNAFFIAKGIARTFYYKEDKEITSSLCAENQIFTSSASFFMGQPSFEIGELMEESTILVLPRKAIEKISLEFLELNYVMRKMAELFNVALEQRIYFLHMKTAWERYENLLKTNSDFFQRIPLGQIASYLGMTQETLSRLRARVGQR